MKVKDPCAECGMVKTASIHTGTGEGVHEHVSTVSRPRFGQQRQPLNPRSETNGSMTGMGTAEYYRKVRVPAVEKAVGNGRQPCQIRIEGVCTGYVEGIHETASRGRSGGLQRAVESGPTVPACHACNRYVSEHPVEAQERGLMRSNTLTGKRHTPRGPVPRRPL